MNDGLLETIYKDIRDNIYAVLAFIGTCVAIVILGMTFGLSLGTIAGYATLLLLTWYLTSDHAGIFGKGRLHTLVRVVAVLVCFPIWYIISLQLPGMSTVDSRLGPWLARQDVENGKMDIVRQNTATGQTGIIRHAVTLRQCDGKNHDKEPCVLTDTVAEGSEAEPLSVFVDYSHPCPEFLISKKQFKQGCVFVTERDDTGNIAYRKDNTVSEGWVSAKDLDPRGVEPVLGRDTHGKSIPKSTTETEPVFLMHGQRTDKTYTTFIRSYERRTLFLVNKSKTHYRFCIEGICTTVNPGESPSIPADVNFWFMGGGANDHEVSELEITETRVVTDS